jgi:hypothetical protein
MLRGRRRASMPAALVVIEIEHGAIGPNAGGEGREK